MKIIFKVVSFFFVSAIFGFLIFKADRTDYYPVSVTVVFKSQQNDFIQVFYADNRGFNELESIRTEYQGSNEFRSVRIDLPHQKISKLRIDPGAATKQYFIRQIEFEIGNQKQIFKGEEILKSFQLTNLKAIESDNKRVLILKQTDSPDVQMLFTSSLNEGFSLVRKNEIGKIQIALIFIYIIILIVTINKGYKILSIFRRTIVSLERFFISRKIISKYSYLIVILLKLAFVSAQQMTALTAAGHDDALFIKLAYSISYGNWLGPYDSLTLVKGFGYPLFIAITNIFGIPLFFAQHLFYALAVYIMVRAFGPLLKSKNWEFALFVILLFNPVISSSIFTRLLRDGIYFSLTIFVLAGFIGLFLRRKSKHQHLTGWAILSGIMLFFHANTREEGVILMPFLLILSIITLIPVFGKSANNLGLPIPASILKDKTYHVSVIMLPYIILIAGNGILASANYIAYGGFIRNEIKSEAFSKAYAALTKIETDYWSINVPVPKEARMKAYEISPTFLELKEFIESENNKWINPRTGDPDEIKGGGFIWAFRSAAQNAAWHNSLHHSQKLYMNVAEEINAAFDKGLLKKKNDFSLFLFTWDNRLFMPIRIKYIEIIHFVIKFEGYNPYPRVSSGETKKIAKFQNITNEIANINTIDEINQILSARIKFWLLNFIARIYGLVNPVLFVVSFVFYLAAWVALLFKKVRPLIWEAWLIASILIFIVFGRMLLIAIISVSQWEAKNMLYLGQLYPFMLAFEIVVIHSSAKIFIITFLHKKVHIKA